MESRKKLSLEKRPNIEKKQKLGIGKKPATKNKLKLTLEDERNTILEKYKTNINRIIEKYQSCSDDYFEVMDIFNSSEEQAIQIESISFIRNEQKEMVENSTLVLFSDVYQMLCKTCDFEDIYKFLR